VTLPTATFFLLMLHLHIIHHQPQGRPARSALDCPPLAGVKGEEPGVPGTQRHRSMALASACRACGIDAPGSAAAPGAPGARARGAGGRRCRGTGSVAGGPAGGRTWRRVTHVALGGARGPQCAPRSSAPGLRALVTTRIRVRPCRPRERAAEPHLPGK
jgi:hypothetical protein